MRRTRDGRELLGRGLLREVQGEEGFHGPGRGERVGPADGSGHLSGVRHQAEPHPRQGLTSSLPTNERGGPSQRRTAPFAFRVPVRAPAGTTVWTLDLRPQAGPADVTTTSGPGSLPRTAASTAAPPKEPDASPAQPRAASALA